MSLKKNQNNRKPSCSKGTTGPELISCQRQERLVPRTNKKNVKPEQKDLKPNQKDLVVGTLLGDSTMGLAGGKPKYSLKFDQAMDKDAYIWHIYEEMSDFVGTGPKVRWKDKQKTVPKSIWFRTYRQSCFKPYFDMFYVIESNPKKSDTLRSRKIVPSNIEDFLNPRVLAYWFMDDGSYKIQEDGEKTYILNTQGFLKEDVDRLCSVLTKKFGIVCTTQKDRKYWRIYIWKQSSSLFKSLIEPYVVKCCEYKL